LVFTASGVDQALGSQLPALVALLMGLNTGVFGGVHWRHGRFVNMALWRNWKLPAWRV
jgi:hypothetical protein